MPGWTEDTVATELLACESERRDRTRFTDEWPELDVDTGYRIQDETLRRRLARGETLVGVKLGPFPFFAIQPTGVRTPQERYVIASAGFLMQDLWSELILGFIPRLREHDHPQPVVRRIEARPEVRCLVQAALVEEAAGPSRAQHIQRNREKFYAKKHNKQIVGVAQQAHAAQRK